MTEDEYKNIVNEYWEKENEYLKKENEEKIKKLREENEKLSEVAKNVKPNMPIVNNGYPYICPCEPECLKEDTASRR